jgi:H+-translocating NAD(P) transhydrogenase subunit alpha
MSPAMVGLYVFVLSCVVGYHVIWGVTPALHTPLMAVTNAISAIVVVGAILVAGAGLGGEHGRLVEIVGFFAVLLASINIFGGFVVTNRILAMFKKKG